MALSGAAVAQQSSPALHSATEYLSPELQAEHADPVLNRGMLWVDGGEHLWREADGTAKSCAACHGDSKAMAGVSTSYPAIDQKSGELVNLEGRINLCRVRHQGLAPFAYESEGLLSLTAMLAFRSRGRAMAVATDGPAKPYFELGQSIFNERQGQFDLACRQCHVDNVGRKLRGDTISSGLGAGFPAYRLEWQGLGSLHRRLRACYMGVRAREPDAGSREHLALELYLAARANGEPVETPALRR
ncbi:MAG: sulfur oxidation c-type cytochrome SoxA [Proteobacteria bacterium]|nr:sulfur oxidation c-type cytochrome SoxA [Pseudomonadota bacterium]